MILSDIIKIVVCYIVCSYYSALYICKWIMNKTYKNIEVTHSKCCKDIMDYKKVSIIDHKESKDLYLKRCIYLCNHRDASDFFIDGYLTNNSVSIGLYKFVYCFPIPALLSYLIKSCIFFSTKNLDREKLYNQTLKTLETQNIMLYPEGQRNVKNTFIPLKTGFIRFAYKNKIPTQIVLAKNKEFVLSPLLLKSEDNIELIVLRSDVIDPHDYASEDKWTEEIIKVWTDTWNKLYNQQK